MDEWMGELSFNHFGQTSSEELVLEVCVDGDSLPIQI